VKKITQNKRKNSGGSEEWLCNLCGHTFKGSYTRVYHHLLAIPGDGVKACTCSLDKRIEITKLHMAATGGIVGLEEESSTLFKKHRVSNLEEECSQRENLGKVSTRSSSSKKAKGQDAVTEMFNVQRKTEAEDAVAEFFFANGISFNATRSPQYKEMMKKVFAAGPSFQPPGYNKMRTTLLDRGVSKMQGVMEGLRKSWVEYGCSIVMDGWTNIQQRPLLNIIVTSPSGPYFLKAIDCSGKMKDAAFQYEVLKDAIEEIGPTNVVQVITDAAPVCRSAGLMIQSRYKHLFWTPCCVHALNNALKDIGKISWITRIILDAREAQMFICNHHASLAIYRIYAKKEFLKPADTRYATYFILLDRMLEVEQALKATVISAEWSTWGESRTDQGKKVRNMLLDDDWWANVKYIVSFTAPIVELIRYADSDSPCLGEIYESIDSMIGKIKSIIRQKDPSLELFNELQKLIEKRWNKLNTPLHMAAYALNPKWYVEREGRISPIDDPEVKQGFIEAIEKMYTPEQATIFREQFLDFALLSSPVFSRAAKEDLLGMAQRSPSGWWRMYGDKAPDIRTLAIRLLSQVASSSAAERNWSTFSFIHSIKRNRLTSKRAEKLVYVHSSLRLLTRKTPEYLQGPAAQWDVDPEDASQIDDDDDGPSLHAGLVNVPLDDIELQVQGIDDDEIEGSEAQAFSNMLELES